MQVDVFEAVKSCMPQTQDDCRTVQEAIKGGFIVCTPSDYLAILDYWQKVGDASARQDVDTMRVEIQNVLGIVEKWADDSRHKTPMLLELQGDLADLGDKDPIGLQDIYLNFKAYLLDVGFNYKDGLDGIKRFCSITSNLRKHRQGAELSSALRYVP